MIILSLLGGQESHTVVSGKKKEKIRFANEPFYGVLDFRPFPESGNRLDMHNDNVPRTF